MNREKVTKIKEATKELLEEALGEKYERLPIMGIRQAVADYVELNEFFGTLVVIEETLFGNYDAEEIDDAIDHINKANGDIYEYSLWLLDIICNYLQNIPKKERTEYLGFELKDDILNDDEFWSYFDMEGYDTHKKDIADWDKRFATALKDSVKHWRKDNVSAN